MAENGKSEKGKGTERTWTDVDANGIGTTIKKVKLSETSTIEKPFRFASTADSFKKLVNGANEKVLKTLYLAALRGAEASVAQTVRVENGTIVQIAGKKVDLLTGKVLKTTKVLPMAGVVAAINARLSSISLLSGDLTPEEKVKMEKRESAWYNAARILVENGKATSANGMLTAK